MSKIVLVSGGGTGIGRAVAQLFALDGDHVALLGRRGDRLADAAAEIADKAGVPVATFAADLADPEQTDRVRQWVLEQYGRVDRPEPVEVAALGSPP